MDRVRGALGRAAEGVLQRPDRPQSRGSVDASRSTGRSAGATELRRADREACFGTGDDGLLLQRGRARFAGLIRCCGTRCRRCSSSRRFSSSRRGGEAHDLASVGAAPARAPTGLGADPHRVRPNVRAAGRRSSWRSGCCLIPLGIRITLVQCAPPRRRRSVRIDTTGEAAGVLALSSPVIGATLALLGSAWSGRDCVCTRRDRRGACRRPG